MSLRFANLEDSVDRAGGPAVEVVRSGIREATYLETCPPNGWPPGTLHQLPKNLLCELTVQFQLAQRRQSI